MGATVKRKSETVFTASEVTLMIGIIGRLDPDKYPHDLAKALIWKCKDVLNNRYDSLRVIET